ncbi:TonB-dependent siderophore receptor [Noviherbaspirillum aerium]|uniref:TonB-dependent siderophore receptor n=1 Tax=Noviherbaspirillum aerium TaxID=2588497 RepID=UPI001CEF9FC2|nr:TonB-dependent siderophore receptor [Noviherbaspirillum aerium]
MTVSAERSGSYKTNSVQVGTFRDVAPLDVPQTSNVVTREVLDAQAATTLFGALRNTAGVTRSQLSGSTYDNVAIRGILVENRGNYRLNGSLPIINLIDIPLENKERVEVLKGASSLYYGFVPPSGIVNLVTKRATKEPVTSFALSANQYGAATAHADIGRRFGEQEQFGARINLVTGREDIGIDRYSGDRQLASAALDWKATRDLSFKLDLEHYRKDVSEQAAIALLPASGGRIALPQVPDAKRNLAGEWQKYDAEATNVLLRTDYRLSDTWSVLFEAGHAKTERDRNFSQFQNYSLVTGAGTLRTFFNRGQEWENTNYRTELFGMIPGSWMTHELTLGFTRNDRDANSRSNGSFDVAQNLYSPVDIAPRSPSVAPVLAPSSIKDRGWYVQDRVSLGERWQLTAGVRSSQYESTTATTRYETDDVNPALALMFKPMSNVSVYASYIEGVEESGQAPANRANAGELLAPAVAKQKEVGVKAEVAQGVLVQAAYFDIKRPSTAIDSANRFVLNGLAQYKGFELAASGELTKQLSLIGSALFLDAEQLNQANAATYGRTPENTPRRTASLFAEYRLPQVPGLALSGGLFYVGERPVDNANQASIGGYTTVSLGARYITRIAGKRTTLQAVLDNATDKSYWSTAGNGFLGVGGPRTLKVAAKVDF